jgi:cyanophycinase
LNTLIFYYLSVILDLLNESISMTFETTRRSQPGCVALLGSGEYLPVMNDVDTYLLKTLQAEQGAHVALLPTASGLELMAPKMWNDMGVKHFRQLGVSDIRATRIIDYESADDPAEVALLEGANLFYFSGGNPYHSIETLRDSLAWLSIKAAYERGAALAGCSAGAMMLGAGILSVRQAVAGQKPACIDALNILPRLIVFPHFDLMMNSLNEGQFLQVLHAIPRGYTALGIDEETAVVRVDPNVQGSGQARWRVMGRQTASVFVGSEARRGLKSGEEFLL